MEGRETEPGNPQSDSRGGAEDAREGMIPTPTSNQQSQPQDPTPQRDRRIVRRTINRAYCPGTRGEGRDRGGQRRGEAKKHKKPQKTRITDAMWKTGDIWAVGETNVDKESFGSVDRGCIENIKGSREGSARRSGRKQGL